MVGKCMISDEWTLLKNRKMNAYWKAMEKEEVDEKIIPLLEILNSSDCFVTSSSCSGRIVLLELRKGKEDSSFYRKWHDKVTFKDVMDALSQYNNDKMLWFKVESFILHVYAKDIEHAKQFLRIAREAGVKRGGIIYIKKFPIIEVFGTEHMAIPMYDGEILVNEEYVRYITHMANKLLTRNHKRLDRFTQILTSYLNS